MNANLTSCFTNKKKLMVFSHQKIVECLTLDIFAKKQSRIQFTVSLQCVDCYHKDIIRHHLHPVV